MRNIRFLSVFLICAMSVVTLALSQDPDPGEDIRLDMDLPSQELYRSAFQDSAPSVVWLEWSSYAFARAVALDKPILLNISMEWDKNRHRMDTEVFSDPSVALIINNFFIPVRVDGDERPDIRKAYGARIWPSIFFLLPDGRPLVWQQEGSEKTAIALGYVNPDAMKVLIMESFRYYRSHFRKVIDLAKAQMASEEDALKMKGAPLDQEIPKRIASTLKANFDLQYGGFGKEPKYPIPAAVELALHIHSLQQEPAFLELASKTLKAIMNSEMNDEVDGGIFRISGKSDWSAPSREKLLDRNASLLSNLLDLYALRGDEEIRNDIVSLLDYIDRNLRSGEGAFLAGQYADFGFMEGYYDSPPEDRKLMLLPAVDRRLFCGENALAASAFIKAAVVLKDEALLEKAEQAVDNLLDKFYSPGRGVFHFHDNGKGKLPGALEDNAQFCMTLIDLYQATGEEPYLRKAADLADFISDNLKDVVLGGFYDFLKNDEAAGKLRLPLKSIDDNAVAARALIRLYYLTGKDRYFRDALKGLELFSGSYTKYGVLASSYGLACSEYFHQPLKVVIIGKRQDAKVKEFLREANRLPERWKIVTLIDEEKGDIRQIGLPIASTPALCFIQGSSISLPVTDTSKIGAQYRKFRKSSSSDLKKGAE